MLHLFSNFLLIDSANNRLPESNSERCRFSLIAPPLMFDCLCARGLLPHRRRARVLISQRLVINQRTLGRPPAIGRFNSTVGGAYFGWRNKIRTHPAWSHVELSPPLIGGSIGIPLRPGCYRYSRVPVTFQSMFKGPIALLIFFFRV